MLAERLATATLKGVDATVEFVELRDVATDIMNNMLTGFASPRLEKVIETLGGEVLDVERVAAPVAVAPPPAPPEQPRVYDESNTDIPAFLRKRNR